MAEYIERESLINHVEDLPTWGTDEDMLDRQDVIGSIENRPAADVTPVRHGRWIEPSRLYYGAKQYECSLCYSDTFWKKHSIAEKYPHCPNCGATMDLEG